MDGKRPKGMSWADAAILGSAFFGLLLGLSVLSMQAAAIVGMLVLVYVVYKLIVTKEV
ncbi:hypothetical protein [Sphingomonas trueperi]|uniref:hypothetical protein n=1 Tax=Sphingomonas trueperi TaxID=53317 RepID=UPI000F1BC1B2